MRLKINLAVLFLAISVLFAISGIVQKIFLDNTSYYSKSINLDENKDILTVVDQSVLTMKQGLSSVTVESKDAVFVAAGRDSDILAWIENHSYRQISTDGKNLESNYTNGTNNNLSPIGSDLWISEGSGQYSLEYFWEKPETSGPWQLLIAANGTSSGPKSITFYWNEPTSNTGFLFSITLATLFLLTAAAMLYYNKKSSKNKTNTQNRNRARRRKTKNHVKNSFAAANTHSRKIFTIRKPYQEAVYTQNCNTNHKKILPQKPLTILLTTILLLSSCTTPQNNNNTNNPEPENNGEKISHPALLPDQFSRILRATSDVVATSDIARDSDRLAERLSGAALEQRTANYKISANLETYEPPLSMKHSDWKLFVPELTNTWPRIAMGIAVPEDTPNINQAFFMQQNSPREPYKIEGLVALFAGIEFPKMLNYSIGSVSLVPQAQLLQDSPQNIAAHYADILDKGSESEWFTKFSPNIFTDSMLKNIDLQRNQEGIDVLVERDFNPKDIVSLATADSGAVVFARYKNTTTISSAQRGTLVNLPEDAAILVGVNSPQEKISLSWDEVVLIHIPARGGEEVAVNVLGAYAALVGARIE